MAVPFQPHPLRRDPNNEQDESSPSSFDGEPRPLRTAIAISAEVTITSPTTLIE